MIQQTFTIKDLSQLSRIKPHTLRIWEQRYGILRPQRTDTNIRQYNQEDLKYLLNVAILYENGTKISQIARLGKNEIVEKVRNIAIEYCDPGSQIQSLVVAMLEFDEERFENIINLHISNSGLEQTITQLVYPFLIHIGILWQTNTINPAQEHFITYLIRQKLIVAIDGLGIRNLKAEHKKVLLFLPEGELHEISLLFACYLVKLKGHKAMYLGQSLPLADLKETNETHKPDIILSIITSNPCLDDVQPYLDKLKEHIPNTPVWLSGYQVCFQPLNMPENFTLLPDVDSMIKKLDELEASN